MISDLAPIRYGDRLQLTIDGVPVRRVAGVGPCSKCGGLRWLLGGPHSPHFNRLNVLVDCVGEPIPRQTNNAQEKQT